ncbi:hypothetical protein CDAR_177981 [Caerostris darwini]|uniref:Uncharacterized protein n=1 Tax=Caerostris darwini TaxID=1538125 RepID=A0AAV4WIM6_9ARAC|nr:hypothetical protein CDAR_177981 [Caerostris darwini]
MRNGENGQKILLSKKQRPLRHTTWRTTWTINGKEDPHPPYPHRPRKLFWRKDGKKTNSLNAKVVIRTLDTTQPGSTTWTINGNGGKEEPSSTLPHRPRTVSGGRMASNLTPLMRSW